jgi:hypothetical protein
VDVTSPLGLTFKWGFELVAKTWQGESADDRSDCCDAQTG